MTDVRRALTAPVCIGYLLKRFWLGKPLTVSIFCSFLSSQGGYVYIRKIPLKGLKASAINLNSLKCVGDVMFAFHQLPSYGDVTV